MYYGLKDLPNLYSEMWIGADGTVLYDTSPTFQIPYNPALRAAMNRFFVNWRTEIFCIEMVVVQLNFSSVNVKPCFDLYHAACGAVCESEPDMSAPITAVNAQLRESVDQLEGNQEAKVDQAEKMSKPVPPPVTLSSVVFQEKDGDANTNSTVKRPVYTKCPLGHATHAFLACDLAAGCGQ
jgi:hypothetical protein